MIYTHVLNRPGGSRGVRSPADRMSSSLTPIPKDVYGTESVRMFSDTATPGAPEPSDSQTVMIKFAPNQPPGYWTKLVRFLGFH